MENEGRGRKKGRGSARRMKKQGGRSDRGKKKGSARRMKKQGGRRSEKSKENQGRGRTKVKEVK